MGLVMTFLKINISLAAFVSALAISKTALRGLRLPCVPVDNLLQEHYTNNLFPLSLILQFA